MKHRIERVREVIRRELGDFITRELVFEAPLVTVQHVDITPDFRQCHVFVSATGAAAAKAAVIATLEQHRVALQQHLAKRVILKYTPHLHFKFDESIERGDRVMRLLNELDLPDDPGPPR